MEPEYFTDPTLLKTQRLYKYLLKQEDNLGGGYTVDTLDGAILPTDVPKIFQAIVEYTHFQPGRHRFMDIGAGSGRFVPPL